MAYNSVTGLNFYVQSPKLYTPTLADLRLITSKYYGEGVIITLGGGAAEYDQNPSGDYRYDAASVLADDGDATVLPADNAGAGRWRQIVKSA